MIDIKIIVKGTIAKFSHAIAGVLYYTVITPDGTYQFPIDMNDKDDVGTTTFINEYKAITLMRYIRKAIAKDELIKLSNINNPSFKNN